MKKYLLVLMSVICMMCITHAQNQGYSWTFGSAPNATPAYPSTPAMTGSAGSYELTLLGDGLASLAAPVPEAVGLGTSCAAPYGVTTYGIGGTVFGLEFSNTPQIVSNTYTIEMAVRFDGTFDYHKLIGFNQLAPVIAGSDDGIYITPDDAVDDSRIVFRVGAANLYVGATSILPNVWHHLAFVRDANNSITIYLNGVVDGIYDDAALNFLPKAANGNTIHFFKDEGTEEVGGRIAKLSVYGRPLTESEIFNRTFNNICNTDIKLAPLSDEGHQWTFPSPATPPFVSEAAVAGSEVGTPHTLTSLGGSPITTGTTASPAPLGASCTGAVPIAVYPTDAGLEFDNDKKFVYDTYTIEMAVSFDVLGGVSRKLVSFEDLSSLPEATWGIYVNPVGHIEFIDGSGSTAIAASPLAVNTWYHLVFTRAADGTISYYQNGALIGTYTDGDDDFIPKSTTGFNIVFFKDDNGTNETSGRLAKLGLFASALPLGDIVERFNNVCNANLVILPVNLKSFTAVKNGSQVDLTWTTASEQNNLGFEVERSANGTDFISIGSVSGNGTTTQENSYYFTDQSPLAGKNYYRLKQIDIDGKSTYSEIRSVEMDKVQQRVALFPNPSRSSITIRNIKNGSQLAIYNSQGNLVLRKIANNYQELISIEKLATGVYLLQITDKDNNKQIIRFSKF